MSDEPKTKKPGWKSTEFYLSLATVAVGLLYASGLVHEGSATNGDKVVGFVAAALATLGYTWSRTLLKKGS